MVFQGEVKGCPVEIWVYETQDDSDDDPSTPVRITTVLRDTGSGQAREGKGEPQHRIPAGETARTIPIEPYTLDDLDEELMEIEFSWEAAAQIISMVRE